MTDTTTSTVELLKARAVEQRKFDASEVTEELRELALTWLAKYEGDFDFLVDLRAKATRYDLSNGQVKGILNCMLAAIRRQAAQANKPARVTEDGWYKTDDGTIWKVQRSQESGNLYAKELVLTGERTADWVFVRGAIARIRPDQKLTLDEAKQFGKLYGVCCICSRTLTNEESIELGIGPVCGGRL